MAEPTKNAVAEHNDVNVIDNPLDDKAFPKRTDSFDASPSGNGVCSYVSTKMTVHNSNMVSKPTTGRSTKFFSKIQTQLMSSTPTPNKMNGANITMKEAHAV